MRSPQTVPHLRLLSTLTLTLLVLGAAACGNSETAPAAAPSTFCKETDKAVCKGNYVATCVSGGTAYKLQFCGAANRCVGGECKPVVCPRGQLTCSGQDVMKCAEDGSTEPTKVKTCDKFSKCHSGACIANTCKKDEVICAWDAAWTCVEGVPTENPCPGSQLCSTTKKGCVGATCTPTEARCKEGSTTVAQTCSYDGMSWTDTACGAGEACYDGVCHTKLAVKTDKDAGSTGGDTAVGVSDAGVNIGTGDTLVGPKKDVQISKPDIFEVTFSKTKTPGADEKPIQFDFASASYSGTMQALTISGDSPGLGLKVEVQIAKIEEFATGPFTQVGGEAGDSIIMIATASDPRSGGKFPWQSSDYDIDLTEFGDVGSGRIVGTFSAELVNSTTKAKAYLVGGKFDIVRN